MNYWDTRSKSYDHQRWVSDCAYLIEFIKCGNFQKNDIVLDVGTGTGTVAYAVAPLVKQVVAIDTSNSMLNLAKKKNHAPNIIYQNCDVRELPFSSETFDKVTARMVFHHILEGSDRAINECNRILRKKGMLIFSEGVPPDEKVKPRYEEIFSYKEERITFMPHDIIALMKLGGFTTIKLKPYWLQNMSIRSWLEDSCVNENLETILKLHMESDSHFKKVYNLYIKSDDVYLDWKFIIATGIKK